jgi:hypothetical protein
MMPFCNVIPGSPGKAGTSMKLMRRALPTVPWLAIVLLTGLMCAPATAQSRSQDSDVELGPVIRAYLGYLKNEQEVVDDRVSRREISPVYYRRNSNRIKALREMALRLARETHNDYLPELEAVARDEFGLLFERQPTVEDLKPGEVVRNTFRFLGAVRSGEVFYVFARLDPYEQADRMKNAGTPPLGSNQQSEKSVVRPRRTSPQ